MASIFEFEGIKPVVHESAYVHPNATIIGNVVIGERVYIGPGAVLRGDFGMISIGNGCNVQENCTVHMFPGVEVILHDDAHIGHGAVIHGAEIGRNCLVGMNAVIMDRVVLGEECVVGALTLILADLVIPRRSLVAGNPGKIIREVSDEMIAWKSAGTQLYQHLPARFKESLIECEPLVKIPKERVSQKGNYKTWGESKPK